LLAPLVETARGGRTCATERRVLGLTGSALAITTGVDELISSRAARGAFGCVVSDEGNAREYVSHSPLKGILQAKREGATDFQLTLVIPFRLLVPLGS
jgi:hypothetical protein